MCFGGNMDYRLTGVEHAGFSADRSDFDIAFQADRGLMAVHFSADHLDYLMAELTQLERAAATLDPVRGPAQEEAIPRRAILVDRGEVTTATMQDSRALLLGLQTRGFTRWYAVHADHAGAFR